MTQGCILRGRMASSPPTKAATNHAMLTSNKTMSNKNIASIVLHANWRAKTHRPDLKVNPQT